MTHEPKTYDLPSHLAKIFRSEEYAAAARQVGKTVEAFQQDVTDELKKLTAEQRQEELEAFEHLMGSQALTAALGKFKTEVEGELKKVVAKARATELAAHEAETGKRAIAKAKARFA
jgi:hypothetical protein